VTLSILPRTSFAAAINFQQILQQERAWAGLQSKQVKVENVMWSYSEGGSSAKPTVLLIHGLAGSRDNWNRVARYLTPYYHVIIPDLPAHGDTQVTEDFDLTIPNLTEKIRRFVEAAENQVTTETLWGTGSPKREFLHVDDLAAAVVHLGNSYNSSEHLNIGTGEDLTIKELAELVAELSGFKGELAWDSSKPDGTPRKVVDVSKAKSLGWAPKISLRDGIASTIAWYKDATAKGEVRR